VSILPKSGHVIFTGRPSQYQGLIAKHFSNQASKAAIISAIFPARRYHSTPRTNA
jgi:hypothetical protein